MSNPVVDAAIQAMTNAASVEASAIVFAKAVPGWINDAVTKALANGATAEQLAPLTALSASVTAKGTDLVAALQANTPVTPVQFRATK